MSSYVLRPLSSAATQSSLTDTTVQAAKITRSTQPTTTPQAFMPPGRPMVLAPRVEQHKLKALLATPPAGIAVRTNQRTKL